MLFKTFLNENVILEQEDFSLSSKHLPVQSQQEKH